VAFGGDSATFDDVKIGYDDNGDGDIDDAGDDLVWDEDFDSNSWPTTHDHAGNMIQDGQFQYKYDAWNP
jgi:hypothetical protein